MSSQRRKGATGDVRTPQRETFMASGRPLDDVPATMNRRLHPGQAMILYGFCETRRRAVETRASARSLSIRRNRNRR